MTAATIDLGQDHAIEIAVWDPDLDLNPEYWGIADQLPAKTSAIVSHKLPGGESCEGAITFDVPLARAHFSGPFWTVESWEPLTLSPSLLCHFGDHGFIRDGRWVVALCPR
jgi:hypothetical protein